MGMLTIVSLAPSCSPPECRGVGVPLCPWISKDLESFSSSSPEADELPLGLGAGEAVQLEDCLPVGVEVPTVSGTDELSVAAPAAIARSPRLEAELPECAIVGKWCYWPWFRLTNNYPSNRLSTGAMRLLT